MIIFTGPEGSGTTYIYKSFARRNPDLLTFETWPNFVFDGEIPPPTLGLHHVSLPHGRPARWLSEIALPKDLKIVASVREKKFAVRSAHRRFRGMHFSRSFEELNYERALSEIEILGATYPLLTVSYETLGDQEVRKKIEDFCGLEADWQPFKNGNTTELSISHPSGLFSCFSVRLAKIIQYFNGFGEVPEAIDSKGLFFRYKKDPDSDITYDLVSSPDPDISIPSQWQGHFEPGYTYFDFRRLPHAELAPFISKYFSPSEKVLEHLNVLLKNYEIRFDEKTYCGVYFRGTNKKRDISVPAYEIFIRKMSQIFERSKDITFIALSDESSFIEAIKSSGLPFITFAEDSHSKTGEAVHFELKGNLAYEHGIHHASLIYLLSKCQHLITTHCNGGLWANLYRGRANNIHTRSRDNLEWESGPSTND